MAISLVAAAADSEGTGTTASVLMPSGCQQNDIIIAAVASCNLSTAPGAMTWPSGWTALDSQSGASTDSMRLEVRWKVFNAGDTTASVTVGTLTQGGWVANAVAYRNVDNTTPVLANSITAYGATGSSAALSTPTATNSTTGVWRVSIWAGGATTTDVTWSGYSPADTERKDNACTAATRRGSCAMADSNGTIDASAGTSVSSTPSASIDGRIAWIGLLNPAAATTKPLYINRAVQRASIY